MAKLNQIIAIEKGVKSRVYSEITELHKASQKPELFNGVTRQYQKKDEEGEDLPPEKKRVQYSSIEVLKRVERLNTELFDVTARKDWTNCKAVADVKIDDHVMIAQAPVTYLLFLEKQLLDLRTFVSALPVLDEGERWEQDTNSGLYKSEPVQTHRTKKVQKPIVLYNATDKHPAQTQLITEDVIAGHWHTEKHSGAIPGQRKTAILERLEKILQAVKYAREEANDIDETTPDSIGEAVFGYLLS